MEMLLAVEALATQERPTLVREDVCTRVSTMVDAYIDSYREKNKYDKIEKSPKRPISSVDANYERYMQARNQLSAHLPSAKTTSASLFSLDPFLFSVSFFPCPIAPGATHSKFVWKERSERRRKVCIDANVFLGLEREEAITARNYILAPAISAPIEDALIKV
jgi:hypothetical protein